MSPGHGHSSSNKNSPSTLVCAACRAGPFSYEGFRKAVAEGHYDETTGYSYKRTWTEISQSIANEACSWCRIVLRTRDGLPADRFPPFDEETVEIRLQIETGMRKVIGIYINGFKGADYTIYANSGDKAVKEIGKEQKMFPKEPYVDYQKAIESIKECGTHEHCPTLEETTLPTRVIDCSNPSKPRLVETNRQIRGYYCTLSYVWGGNQSQKTTKANIDAYRKCIDVPLPQTIADAISVTHKLGLRYLWVDALCIIQDSNEDKENELGIMAYIYRDAYLSISVLSSFRADQGFLPDERAPDVLPFHLANKSIGHMLAEYVIPRQKPGSGKYETVVMHRPLAGRGWCLQESALSARRLIFQPPNVSYKCRSFTEKAIARPSIFERNYENQDPYPVNDYVLFPPIKGTESSASPSAEVLQERWRRMLLDYAECKITVPSDKFVAFASIAEIFQSILKDQYVAGLWRKPLLYDLLWEIWPPMGPDEAPLPRPSTYRAPTWSWASVDAKLQIGTTSPWPPVAAANYEAEILTWSTTPKVPTLPFGELNDARLTLRVKMHPLMRDESPCVFAEKRGEHWGDQFVSQSSNWVWTPPLGNCLEPKGFSIAGMSEKEQEEKRVSGIKFDCVEGTEQDHPRHFYVVILRGGKKFRAQGDWMHGVLVVPVEGKKDEYRRVAKLDLQYHFEWPDWFDATPLKTITLV